MAGSVKRKRNGYKAAMVKAPYKRRKSKPAFYALPSAELKFKDVDFGQTSLGNNEAGTILVDSLLKGITQGNDESDRVGRKITVKKVLMRGSFVAAPTTDATLGVRRARVIVYWDKQCNKATAAVGDLVEVSTQGIDAFRNLGNKDRFVFLYDEIHDLNFQTTGQDAAGTFDTIEFTKTISCYKEVNIPIEYVANAGAVADLSSNNIGVYGCLDGGNDTVSFGATFRIRYTDM